jgi:hypothetical protein
MDERRTVPILAFSRDIDSFVASISRSDADTSLFPMEKRAYRSNYSIDFSKAVLFRIDFSLIRLLVRPMDG